MGVVSGDELGHGEYMKLRLCTGRLVEGNQVILAVTVLWYAHFPAVTGNANRGVARLQVLLEDEVVLTNWPQTAFFASDQVAEQVGSERTNRRVVAAALRNPRIRQAARDLRQREAAFGTTKAHFAGVKRNSGQPLNIFAGLLSIGYLFRCWLGEYSFCLLDRKSVV